MLHRIKENMKWQPKLGGIFIYFHSKGSKKKKKEKKNWIKIKWAKLYIR